MSIRSYIFLLVFLIPILFYGFGIEKDSLAIAATNRHVSTKDSTVITILDTIGLSSPSLAETLGTKAFRDFESLAVFDTPELRKDTFFSALEEGFQFKSSDSLENKKILQQANEVFELLGVTENFVDIITPGSFGQLPIGITPQTVGNVKYTVGIAKAVFKPQYTELTAFLKVDSSKGVLIFAAQDIKLSHSGGIIGEAKLNLISKFRFNLNKGKAIISLNGSFSQPKTYALIDCSGFKELAIDADIKFSNTIIFPVDKEGKERLGYVESSFKTVITDWSDIVVNISLPEFGMKGLKGTTFKVKTAVLDLSDVHNDPAVPAGYIAKYHSKNPELWRGVYVSSLEVILPKAFKKRNHENRIGFGATQMIIDGQGVTGNFFAKNLIPLKEGSASKWQFSLDYFEVNIEANTIKGGEFNGSLVLPVSELDSLGYAAIIQPDEYVLRVSNAKAIQFDLWKAKVTLTKDSFIEMKIVDDTFRPKASLHGSVDIASALGKGDKKSNTTPSTNATDEKDKTVDLKGIVFENLVLQTESPKFSVTYFGYRGEMKIANFPISLNEIGLRTPAGGDKAELVINFNINLTSESDGGNGGGSTIAILAKRNDADGRDHWKFDGIRLERVHVKMDVKALSLEGAIFIFEDDPTYGKGFAGALKAEFKKGVKLELQAKVLFGRTPEFRYWFADAQVTIPAGIPIFTGFALNSFGGGFYNRMKMAGVSNDPDAAFKHIGASSSGVIYEPYNENGFGMKASVGVITQSSPELFHATFEFGIAFLKSGGLQEIYFKGHGELVAALPGDFFSSVTDQLGQLAGGGNSVLPPKQSDGVMSVDVFISFDFVNDIFHATAEVYINFIILTGVGPGGRAGWLDIYIAPDEWHILIGTPSDPIGIALNLGILKIETRSYFMAGDGLPGSPPPPPIVAEILGLDVSVLDYTRDLNGLKAGKGFAFGANISISTGNLSFLIFYASFDAGVGFDVMLKDYGNAHCKGSSEEIGLNGWYANGQAYAYLQGELGVNFKMFGKDKKIPIIKGGGAVIMQARLPNPAWFRGFLGGHYNLLGGLIKGRFRFMVELGEKCEIVGSNPFEGLQVIGEMSPKSSSAIVDVFTAPQVSFNLQINKVFELPDESGDRKYRIFMDKFDVSSEGKPVVGDIEWNDRNDLAIFYPHEILPPNAEIKGSVQVHFEEFRDGRWQTITDDDTGDVSIEVKEIAFTTGEAPDDIPLHNIAYMYPSIGQQNFYTKEYPTGYVTLKRGQSYLFDSAPNYKKEMSLTSATGATATEGFGYNTAKKQITYAVPKSTSTQTHYAVQLVLIPPEGNVGTTKESYEDQDIGGDDDNTLTVKKNTIAGVVIKGDARELLRFDFRTSTHTTFMQKMKNLDLNENLYEHVTFPYGLTLLKTIAPMEPFDLSELKGNEYTGNQPLIKARAVLTDNYYKKQIYPLIYQHYPLEGKLTVNRKTDKVGVPPVEGVEPMSWYLTYLEEGLTGQTSTYHPYRYNLTHYYHQDFEDLSYQVANSDLDLFRFPKYKPLLTQTFPLMRKGDYRVTLEYQLPGGVKNITHKTKYTNPLYE